MGEVPRDQGPPGGLRLPPSRRITRAREIQALLRSGKRKKTSHLDVFFLSSRRLGPRIGLVVPKHGRRVVDRNLLKRRVREVLRREVLPRLWRAEVPLDVLARARKVAYRTTYQQLRKELIKATEEICSGKPSLR
ncbi:ribonuclease P protein component [Gemmatimonadota bacterium]